MTKIPPGWTDDESYMPETEPPQASKPEPSEPAVIFNLQFAGREYVPKSAYDALRADHDEICQAYLNKLSDYSDLYAELMAERNTLARSASEWSRRSIELKAENERLHKINPDLLDLRKDYKQLKSEALKLAEALEAIRSQMCWE